MGSQSWSQAKNNVTYFRHLKGRGLTSSKVVNSDAITVVINEGGDFGVIVFSSIRNCDDKTGGACVLSIDVYLNALSVGVDGGEDGGIFGAVGE